MELKKEERERKMKKLGDGLLMGMREGSVDAGARAVGALLSVSGRRGLSHAK